jgi:hypothetical protein
MTPYAGFMGRRMVFIYPDLNDRGHGSHRVPVGTCVLVYVLKFVRKKILLTAVYYLHASSVACATQGST